MTETTGLTPHEISGLRKAMGQSSLQPEQTLAPSDTITEADVDALKELLGKGRAKKERKQAKEAELAHSDTRKDELQRLMKDALPDLGNTQPSGAMSTQESSLSLRRRQTLTKPHIPTAAEAVASGLTTPALADYLWRAGVTPMALPEDVELPEEPSPEELVAYSILPAFIRQYGWKYKGRYGGRLPHKAIVKQWIQAMTPKDEKNALKPVAHHELRLIVDVMASQHSGQDFNPRLMYGHAVDLRLADDAETQKLVQQSIDDTYAKLSGYDYFFYRTVAPTPDFQPSNWVGMVEYPETFAITNIAPFMLTAVNNIVHYRLMTEADFTPITARWVARTLLITLGCFLREGRPLTPKHLFELAYRFSCDYIQEVHPHDSSFYVKKPVPKFVPPTD